ncbi:MAG TPA: diaminopimelate decarboxylase [Roseiflexaceae bacterium]|nr:diaminopimelate decarboxylase [Roseiflexaceae bacterium]
MLDSRIWPLTAALSPEGHLLIGGCDTTALAQTHGTPLYLLDEATVRQSCRDYRAALARHYAGPVSVHYASKAMLNVPLAQLITQEGLGLDVVSGGELFVALRAGVDPAQIHLHGNAKPRAELEQALAAGVGRIVVDTLDELGLLARLTAGRATPQPVMLRLAPGIAADTHSHIQTGQADSKFGLPLAALDAAADMLCDAPGLRLVGLHAHLGSQLFDTAPFVRAVDLLLECAARLREGHGLAIEEISPGGGVGVPYTPDQPSPDLEGYAAALGAALTAACQRHGLPPLRLVIEPGRSIVARAGVAIYTVLARKQLESTPQAPSPKPQASGYIHIDGGMADNIRPSLYGARYSVLLANRASEPPVGRVHIAGRFCESGDVLLRDAELPPAAPGDLLAVATAGAYTLSMASNYNLAPRPALLLVGSGRACVMQRRETYGDLVARDIGLNESGAETPPAHSLHNKESL